MQYKGRMLDIVLDKRLRRVETWIVNHDKVKATHERYMLILAVISCTALVLSLGMLIW